MLPQMATISAHPVIESKVPGHVGVPGAGAGPPRGTNRMTAKKLAPQSPSEIVRIVARMAIAFEYPVRLCQGSFMDSSLFGRDDVAG
jgi:hypothetical protein